MQEPVLETKDRGFSDYSLLSKSFNNPAMITSIRKQFASVI